MPCIQSSGIIIVLSLSYVLPLLFTQYYIDCWPSGNTWCCRYLHIKGNICTSQHFFWFHVEKGEGVKVVLVHDRAVQVPTFISQALFFLRWVFKVDVYSFLKKLYFQKQCVVTQVSLIYILLNILYSPILSGEWADPGGTAMPGQLVTEPEQAPELHPLTKISLISKRPHGPRIRY